ncbi:hypothetical protein N7508_006234 [Penicillium antarcticum]|uniref:uncharacterized protein n=1 Tax=Penicillium antarcticum TaxID=416450 RepID=UPI0023A19BEB|nr:uncharacterized protein N7508_006234 [Penicillium antarcticum]KAJ5301371.1 hypothetical protein N7508_006234 [Penicillium antarcticum]
MGTSWLALRPEVMRCKYRFLRYHQGLSELWAVWWLVADVELRYVEIPRGAKRKFSKVLQFQMPLIQATRIVVKARLDQRDD